MELLGRLKRALVDKDDKVALPMTTSCSPGWVKFLEHFFPGLIPNVSTAKSPQQMLGAVIKTYYARNKGLAPEDVVVVSVMPCTAKKYEAGRPEMNDSGAVDVDHVLTTRELGRLIKKYGIDFLNLPRGEFDDPLGLSSGAADIFANSGGVTEAALRTIHEVVTGKEIPVQNLHVQDLMDIEGIREIALTFTGCKDEFKWLDGVTARVAATSGLGNARKLMDQVQAGESPYHFIEVMACPGGCIGGGGQPRLTTDAVRQARFQAILAEDEGKELRKSHENPYITRIYEDFLGQPNSHKAHELLHTHYTPREKV
jgi:iron only hydrogenase large subunit-like protein